MLASSVPAKFPIAFASSAGPTFTRPIPTASQIGINAGYASLTDGFPPLNFTPVAAGGVPPWGADFNGLLNQITLWNQWQSAGGPIVYDGTFATGIGGYPKGSKLDSAVTFGTVWQSTVDNNITNPDDPATAANWVTAPGTVPTGTPMASFSTTAPNGYVTANGLTIGNTASNATGRANPDTYSLYAFNWIAFSNTLCPIFTSTGSASTRGANPLADWSANKALATPNMKGLGLIGADGMGGSPSTFLNGVPITTGNTTTPGSIIGENLHALIIAELASHNHVNVLNDPQHAHNYFRPQFANFVAGSTFRACGDEASVVTSSNLTGVTITNAFTGSGTGHNTVDRNTVVYWNQKL